MKIFNSIGHFFAWVLSKGLPAATQAVEQAESEITSPLADAIAALLGSKASGVQSALQAIAGDVLNAFGSAGQAIGAGGLNVQFDEATIAAIKTLYEDVAGLFGKSAPAATPASAPAPASGS